MIAFAKEFFATFDTSLSLKKEMLRIVKFCFDTSNDAYKETCINTFSNYRWIPRIFHEWSEVSKKEKD